MAVHESFSLHITSDKFFIEPQDPKFDEYLIIDRLTQEISLQGNQGQIPASSITKQIVGIFGIIRLVAGPYLIVITKKIKVGEIDGHTIWKVADVELHSYQRTMLHLTDQQNNDNKVYISMLESALKTEGYYFCTDFDLTHTLQRLSNTSPDFTSLPLHERVDQRFVWNGYILKPIAQQPELDRYCLPVVHGYIMCSTCSLNNHTFTYMLISRRCVYRAGTRFFVRGVDGEGQVANFVETEQIVQYNGSKASYVQTRGSIPLFWSQKPDLRFKPKTILSSGSNHIEGFRAHFNDQIYHYGRNVLLNLVNQSGHEGLLEKAFQQTVISSQQSEFISYIPFDFHKECSRMRWYRLSYLMDKVEKDRKQIGYFLVDGDGNVATQQDGVFRTNCIDCLDRTNVVQSMIARTTLNDQLVYLGILTEHEKIVNDQTLTNFLNNVWADNADACSVQYAGTGALKTDFTRLGKRTKMGLLADGRNSLIRYFKNNFSDGFRQDSIDLLLGNYVVEENEGITVPSPLKQERDWKFYAVPVIFLVAFSMLVISILIPDEHVGEQMLYVLFWGGASAISLAALYIYGDEFVDQPRLAQSKFKTD